MHRLCVRGPRRGEERPRHSGQIRNGHLSRHWGHRAHAGLGASGKPLLSPLTLSLFFSYVTILRGFCLHVLSFFHARTTVRRSVIKLMGGHRVTKSREREREKGRTVVRTVGVN